MVKSAVIYESQEVIYGYLSKSKEWVEYKCTLRVKDCGKFPVTLQMKFIPPHPFAFSMPEIHKVKGTSVTDVYVKVVKYFRRFGLELRN